MVSAIVNVNGKTVPVDVRRGHLVQPGTRLPIIDEVKLNTHERALEIRELLSEATIAQRRETELIQEWRQYTERAKREPEDIREEILKDLKSGAKWEFADLSSETDPPIEAIWRDDNAKEMFFFPPEEGLLAQKLHEKNYNFTLSEARQLLKYDGGLYSFDLLRALGELSPSFMTESFYKAFIRLTNQKDSEALIKEFSLLPYRGQVELLKKDSYFLIKQAAKSNLSGVLNVLKVYFSSLPETQRVEILKENSYKILKEAVIHGNIETIKTLLETLPTDERKKAFLYNHAKLLRQACSYGNKDVVKLILSMAKELDVGLPKQMIRAKNYDACTVAIKTGQQEILGHFKKYCKLPNRILKKPFIPREREKIKDGSSTTSAVINKNKLPNETITTIKNPHSNLDGDVYEKLIPIMRMADEMEKTHDMESNAYKLALLFPDPNVAAKWLGKRINKNFVDSHQPIHDAMLFTVPSSNDWTPKDWNTLINRLGDSVLDYLPLAPKLEKAYKDMGGKEETGLEFSRLNLNDLISLSSKVSYIGADANRNFAAFCNSIKPKVTQEGFDKGIGSLQYLKMHPEAFDDDRIPEIGIIDGNDFNHPDYYMRKLSKASEFDAMVSLTIGRFVHCCNHLDGATSKMAIAQTTSKNGGVYALYKKENGKINWKSLPVAKTTVWRGSDSITFNSWEYPDGNAGYGSMGKQFLAEAAARAIATDETINEVTLGGRVGFGYSAVTPKKPLEENTRSCDSSSQRLVSARGDFKKAQLARNKQIVIKSLEQAFKEDDAVISIKELFQQKVFPMLIAS